MEHSLYPVPPRFTVRRLVLMDLAAICTLYGACGRDTAWGTRETLAALFGEGEWWGGFLGGELVVCCACVPARSATPQAAALRGALAPARLPARFLLPPAATPEGRAFAGRFLSLLGERLWPPCASPEKRLAAAVPVKTGGLLLDGFFEAGFTLFLVRPLAALRPHYLLTPPGLRQPAPGTPDEDAVRRVHIPLADTLAVSRLLEQGFCGTALYEGADGQPRMICIQSTSPGRTAEPTRDG